MSVLEQITRGLNAPQLEAVRRTEGPVLALAGAGSGKTRMLVARVAYLIASKMAAPETILAITFTNKAAEEMRTRVAAAVGKKTADRIVISTFHSFCLRVLRTEIERIGYRRNFTISSESDVRTYVRRLLGDLDGVGATFSPSSLVEQIGLIKNGAIQLGVGLDPTGNEVQDKYRTWLPEIFERYQSALRAANALDFDDLLALTLKLWDEHPEVLERYQDRFRHIMVDEYQDTNRIQYRLVRALAGDRRNLCVVGDDDQAIYSWRGADVRNILDFERDFPDAAVVTLDQNYRSTTTILKAANSVIANNRQRRAKNLWSALGEGRPIDWFVVDDDEAEAKTAVAWLKHIQSKSAAKYSDFCLLYRSNVQSRPLEIAFRQAGIPYVVVGGQEFFERSEVKDIIAYLKVLANPRDEAAFLRIVNMPRRGVGDKTLHQVHDLCREEHIEFERGLREALARGLIAGHGEMGLRALFDMLDVLRRQSCDGKASLRRVAGDLIEAVGYRDELIRTCKTPEQIQARWSNVDIVRKTFEEYVDAESAPSLLGFLDQSSLNNDEDRRSRQERRQSGVTLMTVHSAKGLEFPFVFIMGCEDGLFPHEKCQHEGALEEERRLFYVALTRAKRHVTLFEALSRVRHGRTRPSKPSRFLSEIPEALVKKSIRAAREMNPESTVLSKKKPLRRRANRGK